MMNWTELFTKEKSISADEAKQLLESGSLQNYQVLDVRQPKEYEQSHIPGAILIPLSELPDNLSSLDQDTPLIVYCRSGVRSKAACQTLMEAGFEDCLNMVGGILKWQGAEAAGDEDFGLEAFMSDDFSSSFAMAYTMEANLKTFYLSLADDAGGESEKKMLSHMAQLEDGHMAKLRSKYRHHPPAADGSEEPEGLLEGGIDPAQLRIALAGHLGFGALENVLHLAMKLEAQALDLYSRLARNHQDESLSTFFREMAKEEQLHLKQLAKQLDKLLEN